MSNDVNIAVFQKMADAVARYNTFFLTGHVNPDGDSKGSCNCLKLALEKLGKTVVMQGADADALAQLKSCKFCYVQLDVQPEYRLPDDGQEIKSQADFSFCIDHHQPDAPNCDLVYVDPTAASNSLNVWDFVKTLGVQLDAQMATWAYYGLSSDTNSFKNTNTDARSFEAAIEMVSHGADVAQVAKELFQSRSLASFQLEQALLENLTVDTKNRFAFSYLSSDDFARFNATKDDADSFVDLLRSLDCVDVSCLLRQTDTAEKIRGSIRAKTDIDVTRLAKLHVGGGHKAAAGFTVQTCDLHEAADLVKSQLVDLMQGNL